MKVRMLQDAPEAELANALEKFEHAFIYPLGESRTFSISHGPDYPRFFRAIGGDSAASFVATRRDGEVLGTLGVAVRPLQFPDGTIRLAAYLGDLRTAPGPNRGRTLLHLSAAATAWSKAQGAVVAYGIVMGGTERMPSEYTGRSGIHSFEEIHRLCILRLPVDFADAAQDDRFEADVPKIESCYRELTTGAYAPLGGFPEMRSVSPPIHLLAPDHSACGTLEDTREAKRLTADNGQEMFTAHLAQFAYADPVAGVRLIRQALRQCITHRVAPALFVAIPQSDRERFTTLLGEAPGIVKAAATVFGTEFTRPVEKWHLSTSEI